MIFWTFPPIIILLQTLFVALFRRWLGIQGMVSISLISFSFLVLQSWLLLLFELRTGTYYVIDLGRWFFTLNVLDSNLMFCIDILSLVTTLLVAMLTPLALYFGSEYMFRESFAPSLLYLLGLFAASVILLFISYDFFLIILAWEFIGLFSLLLVNFYSNRVYTTKAALKTFVFSRISDMFLFTALILLLINFNTLDLSLMFSQTPFMMFHFIEVGNLSIHLLSVLAGLIAGSGVVKSAQFLFHVWLPDAMEAPTPASALIHSSTLVVAGVYLILRFSLIFEFTPSINDAIALIGSVTLVFSAITASFQKDMKKLVAYSTISQIGYLVSACGFNCYEEALIYLVMHALNKALLFMVVGYWVHYFNGNTDMRYMGNAWYVSFDVTVLTGALILNLVGLPYSAGFVGKEFLITQLLSSGIMSFVLRSCWTLGFMFSPIYMFVLPVYVMFNANKGYASTVTSYTSNLYNYFDIKALYKNRFDTTVVLAHQSTMLFTLMCVVIFSFSEVFYLVIYDLNNVGMGLLPHTQTGTPISPLLTLSVMSLSTFQNLTLFMYSAVLMSFLYYYYLRQWNMYVLNEFTAPIVAVSLMVLVIL